MMNVSCKELRKRAWDKLKAGNYGRSLGASIIYDIVAPIGAIFTAGAMSYGHADFYLAQQRGERPEISRLFSGFDKYLGTLISCFLQGIFIALWSLLFVIPGLVKTFAYSMMYYVMKDFDLSGTDAITKSKELMKGYKWKLFKLRLSFIGWIILGGITFGVGMILLIPYMQAADAEFYAELLACNGVSVGGGRRRDGGDDGRDHLGGGRDERDETPRRDRRDEGGRDPRDDGDSPRRRDPRDDT